MLEKGFEPLSKAQNSLAMPKEPPHFVRRNL